MSYEGHKIESLDRNFTIEGALELIDSLADCPPAVRNLIALCRRHLLVASAVVPAEEAGDVVHVAFAAAQPVAIVDEEAPKPKRSGGRNKKS